MAKTQTSALGNERHRKASGKHCWPCPPLGRTLASQRLVMRRATRVPRGFTLIEILVVLLLIAIGSATVAMALRDGDARTLEHEAARLVALLEGARAESRAAGMVVRWVPLSGPDLPQVTGTVSATIPGTGVGAGAGGEPAVAAPQFQFTGLPASLAMPTRWLVEGTQAQVLGAMHVLLGPEAILPPQRLMLTRGKERLEVASDGLAPFAVVQTPDPAAQGGPKQGVARP